MAGPTTAGRPCQPTNPPPKRYKHPKVTKSQQYGNPQQQYIDPKIIDPRCIASTQCYVANYGHNSTRIKKPTMSPPTNDPHPTLQKNQEKYVPEIVFKNFTLTSTDKLTESTSLPPAANLLSDNRKQETPKPPTKTNSLPATNAKDHTPPKIEPNPQIPGKSTTEPRPYRPPPHRHHRYTVDTSQPTRLQHQSPRTVSNHPIRLTNTKDHTPPKLNPARKFQANLPLNQGPIAHHRTDTTDTPLTQVSPPVYNTNLPALCQTTRSISRRATPIFQLGPTPNPFV